MLEQAGNQRMDTDSRQEQIARAALRLAENGLRAVTVTAVAEAVGLVPSALYRHFRNRNEILRAAFGQLHSMLRANLEASSAEQDPLVGLERFWRRHLGLIRENGAVPRILFSEEIAAPGSPFREMLIEAQNGMISGIAAILARGQRDNAIRDDVDPRDLTMLFLGQILLSAHMFFIRRGDFELEAQVERSWVIFREMLAPRALHEEKYPCECIRTNV
ncbi:MAG: TetR/AcrR family transcriptional regulator [Desulfovibrio sp.]